MPDSSEVDAALSAKLLSDAALTALMPDGVYFDVAAHGKTKFVIISLLSGLDGRMFSGRAMETLVYLVKAVALETTGANVKAAAARIDVLLSGTNTEGGTLTVTGYGLMDMRRIERVRYTEVDESNDARWQHRGGHYELWVSP